MPRDPGQPEQESAAPPGTEDTLASADETLPAARPPPGPNAKGTDHGRLQDPAIVDIHEAGRWPSGKPCSAIKLVSGRLLDQVATDVHALEDRLASLGGSV